MSSTTYTTRAGDTFETVARIVYGDDRKSIKIRRANPGAVEPFRAGETLTIPKDTSVLTDSSQQGVDGEANELEIRIDSKTFRHWTQAQIQTSVDQFSSASFQAPFEPDSFEFRETFRPFRFVALNVFVGGALHFTGTLVNTTARGVAGGATIDVSGYGYPGVLNDCTAPISAFPVELNGLNLQQIANEICGYYDVGVTFEADPGATFRRVKLKPEQTLLSFLGELAKQRNLIVTDNPTGEIVFMRPTSTGSPVAVLRQGEQPLLSVSQNAQNPQRYFSHVTAIKTTKLGSRGAGYTVTNPLGSGWFRANNFVMRNGRKSDAKVAAEARFGRMLANTVTYTADVATWRDPSGALWRPNTTVKIQYPDAMVYDDYEFLIRDVTFEQNAFSEVARLNLVLPGSFTGEAPEALPWDE
jgi:prophage tail gpP-like protein